MVENLLYFQRRRDKALFTGMVFLVVLFGLFSASTPISAQENLPDISGMVFEDLNFNSSADIGENLLANWTISLYRGNELIKQALSDEFGNYLFSGLAAGNYDLVLSLPADWAAVFADKIKVNLENNNYKADFSAYQLYRAKRGYGPQLIVHNVSLKKISASSVEINWFTNYRATGQVVFGNSAEPELKLNSSLGYINSSPINFDGLTYHSIILNNLAPGTKYYCRINSFPDPRQWRGSLSVFSQELSFITDPLPRLENNIQETEKTEENQAPKTETLGNVAKAKKQESIAETGKLSATNLDTFANLEVLEKDRATTSLNSRPEQQDEVSTDRPINQKNCPVYIWILIFLNSISVSIIWSKGKRTNIRFVKAFWWIILILVFFPVILGYPQCWLSVWLLFIFIITLILISGFKKKKPPAVSAYSNLDYEGPFSDKDSKPFEPDKNDDTNDEADHSSSPPIDL